VLFSGWSWHHLSTIVRLDKLRQPKSAQSCFVSVAESNSFPTHLYKLLFVIKLPADWIITFFVSIPKRFISNLRILHYVWWKGKICISTKSYSSANFMKRLQPLKIGCSSETPNVTFVTFSRRFRRRTKCNLHSRKELLRWKCFDNFSGESRLESKLDLFSLKLFLSSRQSTLFYGNSAT